MTLVGTICHVLIQVTVPLIQVLLAHCECTHRKCGVSTSDGRCGSAISGSGYKVVVLGGPAVHQTRLQFVVLLGVLLLAQQSHVVAAETLEHDGVVSHLNVVNGAKQTIVV